MDKKSKEALRRYKKSRQKAQSSSDSSSSSDTDSGSSSSYSSSSSGRKGTERHRKKKARQAAPAIAPRRSSSSSNNERRKREKREHACQKKLEAKRNHLKRKLKEAKMKKRAAAAAAAAAVSGHTHRSVSPTTQAKLKKLAERKHRRAVSKERREREREKHRTARSEHGERSENQVRPSRSPTKITKIRIHQDIKPRQKSPPRVHHQLMSREKIIIQTRTRDRTPSVERQRREHKSRHHEDARDRERRDRDRERAEREAAREKERAEALARCQERQRERERVAREKLRREEEEKKYATAGLVSERKRLLPRPGERELALAAARSYGSRERSLEAVERMSRHPSKRELELYEREREFLEAERRGLLGREELRREREYLAARRRELSPISVHYAARLRGERDLYEEERERVYGRAYLEEGRHPRDRAWLDPREFREREMRNIRDVRDLRELEQLRDLYPDEREHLVRERERERSLAVRGDWKEVWPPVVERSRGDWDEGVAGPGGFVGGPVRSSAPAPKPPPPPPREQRASSEPDWDADEVEAAAPSSSREAGGASRAAWDERDTSEHATPREKHSTSRAEHGDRRWPATEWRDSASETGPSAGRSHDHHGHREGRLPRGFRRGGGHHEHGERNPSLASSFRSHAPPALMTLPVQPPASGFHSTAPRFPNKRNMTYTNPNIIKKQQAALAAAKAAAQASAVAAATTAVAAAKAAAQSSANATTNPSILGQAGGQTSKQREIVEKPEAGEIVGDTDTPAVVSEPEVAARTSAAPVEAKTIDSEATKASGELSEISDSEDDILDKEPIKAPTLTQNANASEECIKNEAAADPPAEVNSAHQEPVKQEDEEMLDFEEISDGELEEDARHKGVGDALGVDWASLIAETKRQTANVSPQEREQITTAKQKWQPHRIFLDVGISMRMAGESYAKHLLQDAKQKHEEELGNLKDKHEIKEEICSTDEDSQAMDSSNKTEPTPEKKLVLKSALKSLCHWEDDSAALNVEQMHPLACIQVAERVRSLERHTLIFNACGVHSRALSARQDLKLRRQLCGLPVRECDLPRPPFGTSDAMRAKASLAFQRALEVK